MSKELIEIQNKLEIIHHRKLIELKKKYKYFTIGDYLKLVNRKYKQLGAKGFEIWNAKFWSELDQDCNKYCSVRGGAV